MPKQLILKIKNAISLANFSIFLGLAAIVCFCVFGTLASMAAFAGSSWVYYAFHYLPYALIALTMPISLYQAWLLLRYRIVDVSILLIVLLSGVGLLGFSGASFAMSRTVAGFMSLFLAMIAWFSMPFLFRVNLRKFLAFLQENPPAKP